MNTPNINRRIVDSFVTVGQSVNSMDTMCQNRIKWILDNYFSATLR
jgi:hypothetical protein